MNKRGKTEASKYIFLASLAVLIILSYFIVQSFIIPLVSAFILAYLTKPIFNKLAKKLPKGIASAICVLLVIIVLILPLGTIIGGVTSQAATYISENPLDTLLENVATLPLIKSLNLNLDTLTEKTLTFIISLLTTAISYIPGIIIALLITLFGMYYILLYWEPLSKSLKNYIPFKDKDKISKEISSATNSIIYGTILIALIEFTVAVIGFFFSGVNAYLLLPSIVFFFAFFPGIGPAFVWVPLLLYYIIIGSWGTAIGVLITGLVLTIYVDLILRNKILGGKAKINPLVMFLGILGGISIFGVFGFVIGPLVLIYTIKLLQETFKRE